MNSNPILVTGIHRSGSTFVGNMLCLNRNVAYIQEPFNYEYGLKAIDTNFKYVTAQTINSTLKTVLDDLIHLKKANYRIPSLVHTHQNVQNRRDLFNELRENLDLKTFLLFCKRFVFKSKAQLLFHVARYNPAVNRILLKDPMACLAAQYLYQQYNMDVVILVRHPLSFAASLKRLHWNFDFDTFLQQPALMRDHLHPFKEEMIKHKKNSSTIVEKACLVWNCIYTVLSTYITANPSFTVCTHEEIAQRPVESFQKLYAKLGLHYTAEIEKEIRKHTAAKNPVDAKNNRVHQLNRDSAGLIHKWKDILTECEVEYVRQKTSAVSANFYDENFFVQP